MDSRSAGGLFRPANTRFANGDIHIITILIRNMDSSFPQFVVSITTKTTSARCNRRVMQRMEDFYKDFTTMKIQDYAS